MVVEADLEVGAARRDDHAVPLAGGARHVLRGADGRDDPAVVVVGHLARLPGGVEDLGLDAGRHGLGGVPHTEEDPAVAARADLEVQPKDKTVPCLFVNHHVMSTAVRVDAFLLHCPLALLLIACHPAVKCFPVKQQNPAGFYFLFC